MEQPPHTIAQHSYTRCSRSPGFFTALYDRLLESDPGIPPMFAQTQFPKQHMLLQHGLRLPLSYAKTPDEALPGGIAARNSAGGVDVRPDMYRFFVDALLHAVHAVRAGDPHCNDDVEAAWQEAMRPGIEFMQSRYRP